MARLIVTSGGETREIELDPNEITSIGREPANTLALPDARGASRRHCQLTPVRRAGAPAFELVDLGATNKTRVNGKAVDRQVLTHGDVILVGDAELTFEDPEEEARLRDAGRQGVCYLEWVTGGTKGERIMLEQPRISIGRRESNTIRLTDRMSSGHHCEIAKDLNGYTIRDLGSTNGTLVNGEPTSEAPLVHGARIRIGNSRFVFKDPSMKDIEVELSQFEEDEGWGMMGDLDLTKARGSYVGLLVGLVILGAAGVGGWYITQQAEHRAGAAGDRTLANEIDNGALDDETYLPWALEPEVEEASVRIGPGGRPGNALVVKHAGTAGAPVTAWYEDEFEALADRPFLLQGWFKRRGDGEAAFVAAWRSDNGAVSRTIVLASRGGGWTKVRRVLVKPAWAGRLRVGVRVAPGATARVDGLRLTREGRGGPTAVPCPGSPQAAVVPGGRLDLVDAVGRALVLGLAPVAEAGARRLTQFEAASVRAGPEGVVVEGAFADGAEPVPAQVTWAATKEGLEATLACAGAARVGLTGGLVRARAGNVVNVLTPSGAQALAAGGGQSIEAVLKTLAGNPDETGSGGASLVTFVVDGTARLELADRFDGSLLELVHWLPGPEGRVSLVTDYSLQRQQAQAALAAARRLLRERPGLGIEKLRELAVEFPFEKAIVTEALSAADAREKRAQQDLADLERSLAAFQIYRSEDALHEVERRAQGLRSEFPPREGGLLEGRVAELLAKVDAARATYYQEVRGSELTRLENLAALLQETKGYEAMAVLYLRAIVERFEGLEDEETPLGRRVRRARQTLAEVLQRDASIAEAVPPAPPRKD